MKMNKKIIIYFSCLLLLFSCKSIKDGLTGKKQENSDEFLVIKKNPLEIPPEFNELPVPQSEKRDDEANSVDEEIENLVKSINKGEKTKSNNTSAEEFVIKEINKN